VAGGLGIPAGPGKFGHAPIREDLITSEPFG